MIARQSGSAIKLFVGFLAIVASIAALEFFALHQSNRSRPPADAAAIAASAKAAAPIGAIDAPTAEAVVGPKVTLSGWALAAKGIRSVEIRTDGRAYAARIGVARPDVAAVRSGYPDNPNGGFEFEGDFGSQLPQARIDRRIIDVVAISMDGQETLLGRRSIIDASVRTRWTSIAAPAARPFFLLPALSGLDLNGASELDTIYAAYASRSLRVGYRVPILYLRMTQGAAKDYHFDPDWDSTRKCGDRRIGDDSLNAVLAHSRGKQLPVLVTLNGGVWADAYCDVPEWDVNDKLEQSPANCQWNEKNEVMPDGHLKDLPGSQEAPELARALTFNVYASDVRHYKKRNLQQAGRLLAEFARLQPELFVGINLDPDLYLNPFFAEQQWYDYNPGTLRQFREWLAGSGAYAGRGGPGVPDLSSYRRAKPLTLAAVNRLSGSQWRSWQEVEPPRAFPRAAERPFWRDPWTREWELFRRHLVKQHYDELAQWLVEVGIERERIWSSQGLMAPAGDSMPFAIELDSPQRNYDTGGMTLAGAKPTLGQLGVILYGEAAVNDVRMDNQRSLFATLAAIDPHWAVVEYNTADLRNPQVQPSYAAGYRGLRDLWNYGTRFVSPMAWNGSNGVNAGATGYSTFTAWRNTPLEEAAREFMLARAGLPLGSVLYTFGTPQHADGDGWIAEQGSISLGRGQLNVAPDANRRLALLSPAGLPVAVSTAGALVVGLPADAGLRRVRLLGRRSVDSGWETLIDAAADKMQQSEAGVVVRRAANARTLPELTQVRIELTFATTTPRVLTRLAFITPR